MFLFYVLSFFKKGDTIRGDIIQGRTLCKEIRYIPSWSVGCICKWKQTFCSHVKFMSSNNVWVAKKDTKRSRVLLLRLVSFFATQTLYTITLPIPVCIWFYQKTLNTKSEFLATSKIVWLDCDTLVPSLCHNRK